MLETDSMANAAILYRNFDLSRIHVFPSSSRVLSTPLRCKDRETEKHPRKFKKRTRDMHKSEPYFFYCVSQSIGLLAGMAWRSTVSRITV